MKLVGCHFFIPQTFWDQVPDLHRFFKKRPDVFAPGPNINIVVGRILREGYLDQLTAALITLKCPFNVFSEYWIEEAVTTGTRFDCDTLQEMRFYRFTKEGETQTIVLHGSEAKRVPFTLEDVKQATTAALRELVKPCIRTL